MRGLTLKMSGLSLPSASHRRRAVFAAARIVTVALAIVLLAGEAAQAGCTPASANNVTATCTGTTTNQGGGADGIYAGTNATVTNNAGASITGGRSGIFANAGFADVINSGRITGTAMFGIFAQTDATVTNNAGPASPA
jgi:hypothetical protein